MQKIEGVYTGANNKQSTFDFTFTPSNEAQPIVIFCHGFKGFKDWGGFNFVAKAFAEQGIAVFKINFSHNGTTLHDKDNFADLESFSHNTLQMEMDDIAAAETYIHHQLQNNIPSCKVKSIILLGHSKGGVSCLLHAAHHASTASHIITWGTPFNFFRSWSNAFLKDWRERGVQYVMNARTRQQMPLHVSLLDDFEANRTYYDMAQALPQVKQPVLVCHGTNDESVPWQNAHEIVQACKHATACIIQDANHTFGMTHPFQSDAIPDTLTEVITSSIQFMLQK